MKTQNIIYLVCSSVFAAIGIFAVGLGVWMHFGMEYVAKVGLANAPNVADTFVADRLFYWPLLVGGIFIALACGGFLSLIISRRNGQNEHAA